MRRIPLSIISVFSSATVLSLLAIVLLVGSAPGTRWLIDRLLLSSGTDVELSAVDGTLLTGLAIGSVRVHLADTTVEVQAFELVPAWGASLAHRELIIEQFAARSVIVTQVVVQPTTPKPFTLILPVLPVAIDIRTLQLGQVVLQNVPVEYVPTVNGQLVYADDVYTLHDFDIQAAAYQLQGSLSIAPQPDVPVSGTVFWRLHDPVVSGRLELADSLRQLYVAGDVTQPYAANVRGRVRVLGEIEPTFDIELNLPQLGDDRRRLTELNVAATGTLARFDARGRAGIKLGDAPPLSADATVSGSIDALEVTRLSLESTHGRALATGRIERLPEPLVDLTVVIQDFDPVVLHETLSGALSGQMAIAWRQQQLTLAIESIEGTLNGAPFGAAGTVRGGDGTWATQAMDIRSGANHVQLGMSWDGERVDGQGTMKMPELGRLVPELRGDLIGTFVVAGSPTMPTIKANVQSHALGFRDWSMTDGHVDIDVKEGVTGHVHVSARTLAGYGSTLNDLLLDAHGSRTLVEATLGWSFSGQRGSMKLSGRPDANGWSVAVGDGAVLTLPGETWRLDRPVTAAVAMNSIGLPAHCWLRYEGQGRVCIDTAVWRDDQIRLVGAVNDLPIGRLNDFVAGLPELAGTVSGRWDLGADHQRWHGSASLESVDLGIVDRSDEAALQVIELPKVTMSASLDDNRTTLQLQAVRESVRVLDLNVAISGFEADSPLSGRANIQWDDLSRVATLSRRIGAVGGALYGVFEFAGTVASPSITGDLSMHEGRLVLVDPQVELTQVDLAIRMTDLSQLVVRGAATSSGGSIEINGTLSQPFSAQRHFLAHVEAARVPVRIPDAEVDVGGQLDVEWQADLVTVKGRVEIPRANITISELPQGAVAVSSDVIVIDRVVQTRGGTRLLVDLELILTDKVHFKAFGLSTNLNGQLRLRQSAEGLVQLTGNLALVNGTFSAYDQILAIESGRLTYVGPPDNPFVDARATRSIKSIGATITVGAHVQGPARDIKTTLFSDPPMSEAETLSYLVLGRSMTGASAEQSNNVTGAAIALGLKGAAPVIDEIRKAIGVDELTATGGNTEDLALIVGKRLNERVFVRYSYQTFTRTGAVLIQLLLSRRLSLEATAAQVPAIDVIYRVGEYN